MISPSPTDILTMFLPNLLNSGFRMGASEPPWAESRDQLCESLPQGPSEEEAFGCRVTVHEQVFSSLSAVQMGNVIELHCWYQFSRAGTILCG